MSGRDLGFNHWTDRRNASWHRAVAPGINAAGLELAAGVGQLFQHLRPAGGTEFVYSVSKRALRRSLGGEPVADVVPAMGNATGIRHRGEQAVSKGIGDGQLADDQAPNQEVHHTVFIMRGVSGEVNAVGQVAAEVASNLLESEYSQSCSITQASANCILVARIDHTIS